MGIIEILIDVLFGIDDVKDAHGFWKKLKEVKEVKRERKKNNNGNQG